MVLLGFEREADNYVSCNHEVGNRALQSLDQRFVLLVCVPPSHSLENRVTGTLDGEMNKLVNIRMAEKFNELFLLVDDRLGIRHPDTNHFVLRALLHQREYWAKDVQEPLSLI